MALPPHAPTAPIVAARRPLKLALQGGGAHGAFTWGVLDALLEDGRFSIEAISGASAGAMNAVALADGLAEGGAPGARAQLDRFWKKASLDGGMSGETRGAFDAFLNAWGVGQAGAAWFDAFTHAASPYDFNPLNINPLKQTLEQEIDFPRLRASAGPRLHVSATNVETGKIKVFERGELTADHVVASACLPTVFQAVEIAGAPYWDGGYMGNPALYPLFEGECADILLVQINPLRRSGAPRTPEAIRNRLNEITFNATLLREFRAIDFVARLVEAGTLTDPRYKAIRMHRIAMSDSVDAEASTKMSADYTYFRTLKRAGRKAAKAWLKDHAEAVGVRATLDLRAEYE